MDKVLCPWCRREMKLIHQFPTVGFWFYCECGAMTPKGKTIEDAYTNADIKRPLQKPLTLEEAVELSAIEPKVILEEADSRMLYAADVYRAKNESYLFAEFLGINGRFEFSAINYGKDWRCWATKPSDEEREAAKWDEQQGILCRQH